MLRSEAGIAGHGAGFSPEEAVRVAVDLLAKKSGAGAAGEGRTAPV